MPILPYRAEMAGAVTESYNRTFGRVPLCYPVRADDVAAAVASPEALVRDPPLTAMAAFAAADDDGVRGFVQAGVLPGGPVRSRAPSRPTPSRSAEPLFEHAKPLFLGVGQALNNPRVVNEGGQTDPQHIQIAGKHADPSR